MVHLNRSAPTVLLADADVFIDYRDSDIEAPEVKTDMADLSTEVKTDIADLRADVESLQTDLHAIETRLVRIETKLEIDPPPTAPEPPLPMPDLALYGRSMMKRIEVTGHCPDYGAREMNATPAAIGHQALMRQAVGERDEEDRNRNHDHAGIGNSGSWIIRLARIPSAGHDRIAILA